MNVFSRTDIPQIPGVTCTIARRHMGGQFPACRTVNFSSREAAVAFRNAVYFADLAAWKQLRREARDNRRRGGLRADGKVVRHNMRPSKIHRPEMLAIDWRSLSVRFIKKVGDFARERNNRAGHLV